VHYLGFTWVNLESDFTEQIGESFGRFGQVFVVGLPIVSDREEAMVVYVCSWSYRPFVLLRVGVGGGVRGFLSLGTRIQIPTRHMLDTLGVQTTSDSNVPSGYRLGTF